MAYIFSPPAVERPVGSDRLWSRFNVRVGQTLLKKDGFYSDPSDAVAAEDIAAADAAYLGGHLYLVSDAEAGDLTAAGYGDCLTVATGTTYGSGPYGAGPYGGVAVLA